VNNRIRKITYTLVSFLLVVGLVGCGANKNKKNIVDSQDDKFTKVVVLTSSERLMPKEYASANALVLNNDYQKKNRKDEKVEIDHMILPDDMESEKLDSIFKKLVNDKKMNVLVVASQKTGISKYIDKLNKVRNDIITISSNSVGDKSELANTFDIVLDYEKTVNSMEVVSIAKTLGAERFLSIVDLDDGLDRGREISMLEGIKNSAKNMDIPYEEIRVPSMDLSSKKAYISNLISENINKYGSDISFYPTSSYMDEVLLNRVVTDKFIIPELSQRNSTKKMMQVYGLKQISRVNENYKMLNDQISNFYYTNYGLSARVAGLSADPRSHIIKFASQLGITLNSKEEKVQKAYNTYYLEQISSIRTQVSAGFKSPLKRHKNYKLMSVDQIVY